MLQRILELQNYNVTLFLVQTSENACSFILHEAHKRMKCFNLDPPLIWLHHVRTRLCSPKTTYFKNENPWLSAVEDYINRQRRNRHGLHKTHDAPFPLPKQDLHTNTHTHAALRSIFSQRVKLWSTLCHTLQGSVSFSNRFAFQFLAFARHTRTRATTATIKMFFEKTVQTIMYIQHFDWVLQFQLHMMGYSLV
jgi:hypothetical protein